MDKICPLKFNSRTLNIGGKISKKSCKCEGSGCELWIDTTYTTETVRIEGCAIKLNAMKNSDGLIAV